MYIEELKEEEEGVKRVGEDENSSVCPKDSAFAAKKRVVILDAKRLLVGAGARALFYPTLLYNVVRNRIESEFRWWDRVDEFILLGAVPFPSDVPRLKEHGVLGVITLNEPYETLVPTSLYKSYGIEHLVIPTRDYYFAPSLTDICQAVNFIHRNASHGQTTYVHCKAGRGRSTTIVLCYLVQHKQMTPEAAYSYVKSIRPRVLLAPCQWQAVQEFYHFNLKIGSHVADLIMTSPKYAPCQDLLAFDEGSVVVVTEADLDGYDPSLESSAVGSEIWADVSVVCRVRVAGQAALARVSCLWLRCRAHEKIASEKLVRENSCLGSFSVDIHVY
ncbi:hypothetical protein SLEP1_g8940 [Rubroshorea leprosula]|uniref:phosphatidylglycerophosphatase n=1 Tax=Rubroshorea leprosula TaxID=152421 RepID=A0AAV5IEB1_9ROSI|nr:hypothetical protein SLEP1_g8940 [Rubroshorea leprosula]